MTEEENQNFLQLVRQHQDEVLKLRRRHRHEWFWRNNLTENFKMEDPTLEETDPVLKYNKLHSLTLHIFHSFQ